MKNVRIYDNGGETADRYTAVYLHVKETDKLYGARGMSADPYHPQGVGAYCSAQPGRHLGRRIQFEKLPEACRRLVSSDLAE